jgi:diacylglycerol kinase (ATP)
MERQRGFVIVFNPHAGRGRAYETLREVTTSLDGRIAPVVETALDGTFGPTLRDRIRTIRGQTGMTPIALAVGGDGTLSLTLNGLRDPADAAIAVVPAGSGNDFAAAIGLHDVRSALLALETGAMRRIDLGLVNGRRFANCVGMGLDAEVGSLAFRFRSRGYPAGPSYYAAALVGLFLVKPVGITIESEGRRNRFDDGVMVTVGNGPLYGGGFRGAPNAMLDDGALDVYAFSNVDGIFRRLALMRRIRAGTHDAAPNVKLIRAASLIVEFDRAVAMHVDGETMSVRRAEIGLVPGGLEVVAPAKAS